MTQKAARCDNLPTVSLLTELDAFFTEHRDCGDLDGDAKGERAWLACRACGARIEQRLTAYDA
jgi:hypothetical protein